MFIACIDNLTGFAEIIEAVFSKTKVRLCVIQQIRNSIKYLSYKDVRPFVKDLQGVYKAAAIEQAERYLDRYAAEWGARYPNVIESCQRNWPHLNTYFEFNKVIRRIIHTTNAIESFRGTYDTSSDQREHSSVMKP